MEILLVLVWRVWPCSWVQRQFPCHVERHDAKGKPLGNKGRVLPETFGQIIAYPQHPQP